MIIYIMYYNNDHYIYIYNVQLCIYNDNHNNRNNIMTIIIYNMPIIILGQEKSDRIIYHWKIIQKS